MQFVHISGETRHECIACGTNLLERAQEPNLTPTVDIYNPWGRVSPNVKPNCLYDVKEAGRDEELRKIFHLGQDQPITHSLETVRFFSFKWWQ